MLLMPPSLDSRFLLVLHQRPAVLTIRDADIVTKIQEASSKGRVLHVSPLMARPEILLFAKISHLTVHYGGEGHFPVKQDRALRIYEKARSPVSILVFEIMILARLSKTKSSHSEQAIVTPSFV